MFSRIRILDLVKIICLLGISGTLIYSILTITNCIKQIEQQHIPFVTTSLVYNVEKTLDRLDKKVDSIESNIFRRVDSIEFNTFKRIDTIENKAFVELTKANRDIHETTIALNTLTQEYGKIPHELFKISSSIKPNLDCNLNDYCWPNLMTDVLIDSRNMVRDGTKTFNIVNKEVPKLASDFNKVSTSLAVGIPKITDNSTKITDNIQKLTKPKWYDRVLGVGANASLIYFNVARSR